MVSTTGATVRSLLNWFGIASEPGRKCSRVASACKACTIDAHPGGRRFVNGPVRNDVLNINFQLRVLQLHA